MDNILIHDWRYKFVFTMFTLSVVIGIVAVATGFSQYSVLSDVNNGINISDATIESNESLNTIVSIIQTAIAVLTVIAFLLWFYKAHKNTTTISANPLKYSPAWSVGGFFIPLINLVLPYKIAKEIWYASSDDAYDNNQLNKKPMVGFIMIWWLLFIFSSGASRLSSRLILKAEELQSFIEATISYIVSDSLIILGSIAALYFIKTVSNIQNTTLSHQNASS
ncbi:MAG: DUF4328 domain-containing protein [Methylococcales bacterium]